MNQKVSRPVRGKNGSRVPAIQLRGSKRAVDLRTAVSHSRGSGQLTLWMRDLTPQAFTLTIGFLIVLAVFTLAPNVQIWFHQRQQIADLQAQVAQAKEDLNNMETERQRWQDPVYIRSQARDRLYYVMPGEVSYLVMDAEGIDTSDTSGTVGAQLAKTRSTAQISSKIQQTRTDWVSGVLETFMRAGTEEPTK